ncbi:MAG: DUF192 domain-containing protein [Bacteroidales bacterium]|nr:DUF192 domain-containing protein [Bacteroidales bacterium]
MKSSKNNQKSKGSKIRGNYQQKKGPVLLYFTIFIVVSIAMITLNQTRKKNLNSEQSGQYPQARNDNPSQFNKEGELNFLDKDDKLITSIDIEIADDDYQTQRGLMYRRSMREDRGMLFIFPDIEERSFWMKNTYISLDILYIDANKEIVSIAESVATKSEESIWSGAPAKYVIEVVAGFVAQHQIEVGDRFSFKRVY